LNGYLCHGSWTRQTGETVKLMTGCQFFSRENENTLSTFIYFLGTEGREASFGFTISPPKRVISGRD
jgi:hypothetical protein